MGASVRAHRTEAPIDVIQLARQPVGVGGYRLSIADRAIISDTGARKRRPENNRKYQKKWVGGHRLRHQDGIA